MNMHVKPTSLKLANGKSYRGKSGAVHRVETNDNSAWPFKTADTELRVSRFWKVDGSAYNTDGWNSHATLGDDLTAEAPLFTAGDKVRATRSSMGGGYTAGKTYVVKTFGDNHIQTVRDDFGSRTNGWGAENFEPIPTHTTCAAAEVGNLADEYGGGKRFKIEASKSYVATDGLTYGPFKKYPYGDSLILEVGDGNIWSTDGKHGDYNPNKVDMVAVAPATATTFTIQAGRYYKTRDGRKVGPMRREEIYYATDGWHYDIAGKCAYEGGSRDEVDEAYRQKHDLIAEWPDASDDVSLRGVSPVAQPVVAPATTPATTAKFKVGDRVGCTTNMGTNYVIKKVDGEKVDVAAIRNDGSEIYTYPRFESDIFFLLPHTTPTSIADIVRKHSGTAIVCLLEDGQPLPSTRPFVHLNKEAANTEADRLAGIHKGSEFGVYECVDVRKEEKTYEHEWQRLATSGQKINAIKHLRGMTGLGLATTKDAVEDWLRREAA